VDIGALQRRRDVMVEALASYGYDLHSPEGTFYLLPTSPIPDDIAFVDRLAKDKVFVLPGAVVEMPGRFRISVTGTDEMVQRALPIFEQAAREA
jgi:aspartate aminotransferase